jgi:hypothetical protein
LAALWKPRAAVRDALKSIAGGTASFESRAKLEHHLLRLLRRRGTQGVSAFLRSLPEFEFTSQDTADVSRAARFVANGPNARRLIVTTFLEPHSASVNIGVEDDSKVAVEPDPRHRAFYETWESMLGLGDSEVHGLDARRRAVFYVGLLEAEVMNGGLGQYLSNTEGAHVDATLRCLAEIGAPRTAAILTEAARLGATAESYTAAWDSHGRAFERLDREFLESGEDLAGLTSDAFSGTGRGD